MDITTLEPGTYIIGDPCYVIHEQDWLQFLTERNEQNGFVEFKGHQCVAYNTHGDGYFRDNQKHGYAVDSRFIGAVPAALFQNADPSPKTPATNREVTFGQPFECTQDDDGAIRLGHISINIRNP